MDEAGQEPEEPKESTSEESAVNEEYERERYGEEAATEQEVQERVEPRGFCWLPGPLWGASLGLGVMLFLGGFTLGLSGAWTPTSLAIVVSLIVLIFLWDKPTARFPIVLLLLGLDAGAIASAGASVVIPPIYIERDVLGSTIALDPAALAVIVDVISRILSCKRVVSQRNKTPPPIAPPTVPR